MPFEGGGDMWKRETDYVDDGRKEKNSRPRLFLFFFYFFICLFLLLSLFCVLLARVKTDGAMGQWGNGAMVGRI